MTAFAAITKVTFRQLTERKRVIGFGVLSIVPAALLFFSARGRVGGGVDSDLAAALVTPFFNIVLPLIALVMAGSALGDERKDKTLSFLVLRPRARVEIAAAKTLAACLVATAFGAFAGLALTVAYMGAGGGPSVLPAILVGATISSFFYGAVFVLLGYAATRPTLIGLVYLLFFESVVVGEIPGLAATSPWRVGLAATIDLFPQGFPGREIQAAIGVLPASALGSGLRTVTVVIVSILVCATLLKRTDSV
jgi:ABC-type transport system involved in multi-copper enzyme maturation permease subunit